MTESLTPSYTAFEGHRRLVSGTPPDVALAVKRAGERGATALLTFDDATGRVVDLDLRGTDENVIARYTSALGSNLSTDDPPFQGEPRGRGRPRLGVVAREITLLPRHWEWLNAQPGGASVALRKLVEEARRAYGDRDRVRAQTEAAYRFMSAVAGNFPGFEDATRALFAGAREPFVTTIAAWPQDVREHTVHLAFPGD